MKPAIDATALAAWCKACRAADGITQRQLAERLGTTPGVIGALERGNIRSRPVAAKVLAMRPDNFEGVI